MPIASVAAGMTRTAAGAPSTPAHSTLACYLEVLAVFRPDPTLAAELDAITEDPTAATDFPTCRPGTVPHTNLSLLLRGPAGAEMLAK